MMGAGSLVAVSGGLLASCSNDTASSGTPSSSGSPTQGGTLRVGIIVSGTDDTLDPTGALTVLSFAAVNTLYDGLTLEAAEGGIDYVLAEEMTANADATKWTVRIRDGIEFHNGKPLTADDVVYTFRRIADPATASPYASTLALVDAKNIRKVDDLTVEIPCTGPFSIFPQSLTSPPFAMILPEGFDPKKPVGTGPYMFDTFTPGRELVVKRNPNYFESGKPYLDEVIFTGYPDEASQVNALEGGQLDVITGLTAGSVKTVESGGNIVHASKSGGWTPIVMNMSVEPFSDPDVRTAMKLLVDREQAMNAVWGGEGTIGNDIFGLGDPNYNTDLTQREYDPEQAKSLLEKAGKSGLTAELVTAPFTAGAVELATVFAEQTKAGGIDITVKKVDSSTFFGDDWLNYPLTSDYWSSSQLLPVTIQTLVKGAPYNETHFVDARHQELFNQAMATTDEATLQTLIHEMQSIEWDTGGYIIPFFNPVLVGHNAQVQGIADSLVMQPLDRFRNLITMWRS